MRKITLLLLAVLCMFQLLHAGESDSLMSSRPRFFSLSLSEGLVIPNNHIFPGEAYKSPSVSAVSLKYAWAAKGGSDFRKKYGDPYLGFGAYLPRFEHHNYIGSPFSFYLLQGGRLKQFSQTLSLHYEINLGVSFNWNHYNRVEYPNYISIGSKANIHLGGNAYLKWKLSNTFDMNAGLSLTHFSNGAQRVPNYGMNVMAAYVEMVYHIQRAKDIQEKMTSSSSDSRTQKKAISHDLMWMATQRTIKIDPEGTGMLTKYPEHRFFVTGLSYGVLFPLSGKIKLGPSLEAAYDKSVNAVFSGGVDQATEAYTEHVTSGKSSNRFSAGVSLKGELEMPGYSIYANIGYNVLHEDKRDSRIYFIYGLKAYVYRNLFGTFAVRTNKFTQSRYLYVGIGYTFKQYKKEKSGLR